MVLSNGPLQKVGEEEESPKPGEPEASWKDTLCEDQGRGQWSRKMERLLEDVWRQNTEPTGSFYRVTYMNFHQPQKPAWCNSLTTKRFQF